MGRDTLLAGLADAGLLIVRSRLTARGIVHEPADDGLAVHDSDDIRLRIRR